MDSAGSGYNHIAEICELVFMLHISRNRFDKLSKIIIEFSRIHCAMELLFNCFDRNTHLMIMLKSYLGRYGLGRLT
jgi:hypothetical protein